MRNLINNLLKDFILVCSYITTVLMKLTKPVEFYSHFISSVILLKFFEYKIRLTVIYWGWRQSKKSASVINRKKYTRMR